MPAANGESACGECKQIPPSPAEKIFPEFTRFVGAGQSAVRNAFQGNIKMRQRLREAPTTRITLPSEALGKVHGKCKQSERGGRRSGGGGGPAGGDKAIGFCLSLFALMDPTTTTARRRRRTVLLFSSRRAMNLSPKPLSLSLVPTGKESHSYQFICKIWACYVPYHLF